MLAFSMEVGPVVYAIYLHCVFLGLQKFQGFFFEELSKLRIRFLCWYFIHLNK